MLVVGPQRGLFLSCLALGVGSLLLLDLHFAPASLAAENNAVPVAPSESASTDAPAPMAPVSAVADAAARPRSTARATPPPAYTRVPTIVARFGSEANQPVDEAAVKALATAMIEDHDVSVVLEGHSDTRGSDDYNHRISLERATWVKTRLIELGVSGARMEAVGLGSTHPLRSDEPDAQSVNRRVEVKWLGR